LDFINERGGTLKPHPVTFCAFPANSPMQQTKQIVNKNFFFIPAKRCNFF
jgi:hypothetical protein